MELLGLWIKARTYRLAVFRPGRQLCFGVDNLKPGDGLIPLFASLLRCHLQQLLRCVGGEKAPAGDMSMGNKHKKIKHINQRAVRRYSGQDTILLWIVNSYTWFPSPSVP